MINLFMTYVQVHIEPAGYANVALESVQDLCACAGTAAFCFFCDMSSSNVLADL